jgi:chromatin remodeling complex protein RSC6
MDKFFAPLNVSVSASNNVSNEVSASNNVSNNVSNSVSIEEPVSIETQFTSLLQELTQLKSGINDVFTRFRLLEKSVAKELKASRAPPPSSEPKKRKTAASKSAYDIPAPLTAELCKFMNLAEGSEAAPTQVTQYILNYIQVNKLTKNRTEIIPDEALAKLFGPETQHITHFNLQKHISYHIIVKS